MKQREHSCIFRELPGGLIISPGFLKSFVSHWGFSVIHMPALLRGACEAENPDSPAACHGQVVDASLLQPFLTSSVRLLL